MCYTDRCLCSDMCAAHHFSSSQRFLHPCSLPEDHQSWHFWTSQCERPIYSLTGSYSHFVLYSVESSWTGAKVFKHVFSYYAFWAHKQGFDPLPCSAICISLRPNSAWAMFLTQKSEKPFELFWCFSLGEHSSSELSLHTETQDRALRIQRMGWYNVCSLSNTETHSRLEMLWTGSGFASLIGVAGIRVQVRFFQAFEVCVNCGSDWHVWERLTEPIRAKLKTLKSSEEFSF